jgi:hypothetical protein
MKVLFLLILSLAAQRCIAQETNQVTHVATNSATVPSDLATSSSSTTAHFPSASSDRFIKQRPPLSAGKRIVQAPRRFLHIINPFAPTEPKEGLENLRGLSPRAWTTTVGWHSGGPSFGDPVTHESSLGLFDLRRSGE